MIHVIILNGGSSSGKTSIARNLQAALPTPWLRFSIDDLVDALPPSLLTSDSGLAFGDDGSVRPGAAFQAAESAWMAGIAAMARAGARVIIDDVFVSGVAARDRWQAALAGASVLWVGVRCDPAVATAREASRGDRVTGMAALQSESVHAGITYDLEVDSSASSAVECAQRIAQVVAAAEESASKSI